LNSKPDLQTEMFLQTQKALLDFSRPIGLTIVGKLNFITDSL